MSEVELDVSDEFDAWLVAKVGLVDFRAIRVSFYELGDTPTTGCFSILPKDWRGL